MVRDLTKAYSLFHAIHVMCTLYNIYRAGEFLIGRFGEPLSTLTFT